MLNKLILFGLLCFVWSDPAQFEKFKRNFDRKYSNQSEEMRRYNIFSENLAKITQHNSREGIDCDDDMMMMMMMMVMMMMMMRWW